MTTPNFRTPDAIEWNGWRLYRRLYADSPNPYLLLTPELMIIDGNDAYLAATGKTRDELANRFVFDAFPANPHDPTATGVPNIRASFERALRLRRRDSIPLQRYDLCHDGIWQVHYWHPTNWPIIDDDENIVALVHHVQEVTVPRHLHDLSRQLLEGTSAIAEGLQDLVDRLTKPTSFAA